MAFLNERKTDDAKAFELLFRKYYQCLCVYANKFIANQCESEEIVQQVFLNVWMKKERLDLDNNIRPYLFKSVKNLCFNIIEHKKIVDTYFAVIEVIYKNCQEDSDPYDLVQVSELQNRINHTITLLPEQCRKIFQMSREDDLKYSQIANTLGISVKTVETQIRRALIKLKFELKDYLVTVILLFLLR